jgi:hypothetical protein
MFSFIFAHLLNLALQFRERVVGLGIDGHGWHEVVLVTLDADWEAVLTKVLGWSMGLLSLRVTQ